MKRRAVLLGLLLAACAQGNGTPPYPVEVAGSYRLDYSGVYGVGRIDLLLKDGAVSGLNPQGAGPTYRGIYRSSGHKVTLDLIAHLPPSRQTVDGVVVTSTARDVPVRFSFPPNLSIGAHAPIEIELQAGPITGEITRLP